LSADAFLEREAMAEHAGAAALRGLLKEQGRPFLHDGLDGQTLDRGSVAAAALALSMELRHRFPGRRVGIVLPPGKAGVIANLAVILADKVPVNLNFTAGRMAVESSMQKAELPLVISAGSVIEKFPEFPWPTVVLRMEEVMPALKNWTAVWRLLVACVPWWLVRALAGVPRTGGDREAFLLFTSGSVGTPKGVPLTHRNVLANVYQFGELLEFDHRDAVLGSLPLFHSFGATVTLLYPMISGVRLATHPNPLDIATHAALIERFGVTLAVTTPTFLRGWLRKVKPEQIRTLKMVVTGAEKLPGELAALFEERMGKRVYQGYGLTETSPVVSFNQPNPPKYSETDSDQCSEKSGSCGKIVLGLAAQVRDPVTGERISMHDTGMLWVRGANVFGGYLNEPERTAEVLVNGWFRTGDLARFDDDGFLFIEGRLSRFSKIGGEMVPHETVESKITECFGWQDEGERVCCITGIPDEAKGEALVLLTTKEVTAADVRGRLSDAGFANLWIPRRIVRVDKVPVLGSGKLDIQQAQKLAHNAQE
jgi:acyl-[acyl-carrier-protein]-phospholipid O-acyltransferase/long-chain-fatty-acid--[acyl-carrier-protein] ligase